MQRQIYIVDAWIADTNGTFNYINGYPKRFDSRSYGGDIAKTYRRADGDASDVWGDMQKVDTRQIQTVQFKTIDGHVFYTKTIGRLADDPDPEPEPEPEPDPEPEPEPEPENESEE